MAVNTVQDVLINLLFNVNVMMQLDSSHTLKHLILHFLGNLKGKQTCPILLPRQSKLTL